jgi:hypothetical protein
MRPFKFKIGDLVVFAVKPEMGLLKITHRFPRGRLGHTEYPTYRVSGTSKNDNNDIIVANSLSIEPAFRLASEEEILLHKPAGNETYWLSSVCRV